MYNCTINTYYCDKTTAWEVLHSGTFQWFVMYLCCSATRGLHLFTEFWYEAPLRRLPDGFLFLSTYSWWVFFCVFSSHILPFPAPFSLTRWEQNSSALPVVVCVLMWLSPRTTTLAYSPKSHPSASFFFIIELKCSSFHRQQCQESMRDTLSAHTHTHTCRRAVRHGPPGDLGEIGPRQYLDWVCLPPIVPALLVYPCLPSVHKACAACLCVFSCMHGIAKCICADQRGLWRALCAYLRVCRCAEVCKPLFACIYLCLVCLEL